MMMQKLARNTDAPSRVIVLRNMVRALREGRSCSCLGSAAGSTWAENARAAVPAGDNSVLLPRSGDLFDLGWSG